MTAIEASSYTMRTLVDGTLAVTLHVEPRFAADAFRLFGQPGQAVAVAALKTPDNEATASAVSKPQSPACEGAAATSEGSASVASPMPKGGPRSKWLALRCLELDFQIWVQQQLKPDAVAAAVSRAICEVASRAEIDNDPEAERRFRERILGPWQKHYGSKR